MRSAPLVAFASFLFRPAAFSALKQPLVAWVVGVGGLFGYHALYFLALRFAPPAEAGLLNYLWPLLIVLFSSLLPGERLAPHHIIGALLGLAGTVLLFAGNSGELCARPDAGPCRGLRRRLCLGGLFGDVAQAQGGADRCGRGLLSRDRAARRARARHGRDHGVAGDDRRSGWPIVALGVGPVGAAFFVWDIGMKRGDIRVLGAASYATPLLSTAFLILAGFAQPTRDDRDRRGPDRRRRTDRGEGYGVEKT